MEMLHDLDSDTEQLIDDNGAAATPSGAAIANSNHHHHHQQQGADLSSDEEEINTGNYRPWDILPTLHMYSLTPRPCTHSQLHTCNIEKQWIGLGMGQAFFCVVIWHVQWCMVSWSDKRIDKKKKKNWGLIMYK